MMHTDNIHLKDDLLPPEIRETMRTRHKERPHNITAAYPVADNNKNAAPERYVDIKLESAPVMHPATLFALCFLAAFSLGMIIFR